jgi:hypothetical protein
MNSVYPNNPYTFHEQCTMYRVKNVIVQLLVIL